MWVRISATSGDAVRREAFPNHHQEGNKWFLWMPCDSHCVGVCVLTDVFGVVRAHDVQGLLTHRRGKCQRKLFPFNERKSGSRGPLLSAGSSCAEWFISPSQARPQLNPKATLALGRHFFWTESVWADVQRSHADDVA
jgi:hypothetical protein